MQESGAVVSLDEYVKQMNVKYDKQKDNCICKHKKNLNIYIHIYIYR